MEHAFLIRYGLMRHVGRFLAGIVSEVIVSTGGDYFVRSKKKMKLALYQGQAAGGLSVVVDPKRGTQGVFTSTGRIRLPRYQISSRIFPLCSATPPEADFRPTVRTPEDRRVYARQVRVDIRDLPPMLQSRSFARPPSPCIR